MLRRNGTGRTTSASRPTATVVPLRNDRAPGGLHRGDDRLVALEAVRALLAPAHDDEQRVVDGHAQPDQGDEELHDRRDLGDRRQRPQQQERVEDRRRSPSAAARRPAASRRRSASTISAPTPPISASTSTPGPFVAAARSVQRVVAGEVDWRPADGAAQRIAQPALGVDERTERIVAAWREDVDERGAAVARGEHPVPGGPEARDARAADGLVARSARARAGRPGPPARPPSCPARARPPARAAASRRRCRRAALDLLAGLPALAVGDAEALVERRGRRSGGRDRRRASAAASRGPSRLWRRTRRVRVGVHLVLRGSRSGVRVQEANGSLNTPMPRARYGCPHKIDGGARAGSRLRP